MFVTDSFPSLCFCLPALPQAVNLLYRTFEITFEKDIPGAAEDLPWDTTAIDMYLRKDSERKEQARALLRGLAGNWASGLPKGCL